MIPKGRTGEHHGEGLGVGFVPPPLDRSLNDEARSVPEQDARMMCQALATREGLLVGTSSGLTPKPSGHYPSRAARNLETEG